jgi:hypothetical protein
MPVHAPVHPVKIELEPGLAVRVTDVPTVKLALHVSPKFIPAGALVTVPVPSPAGHRSFALVLISDCAQKDSYGR